MGNPLTKSFHRETKPLSLLQGKSVAIDISTQIYQAIYGLSIKGVPLKDSQGRFTSHIKKILIYLSQLRKRGIDPIVCVDDKPPFIKRQESKKRNQTKTKIKDKFQKLKSLNISLTQKQEKTSALVSLTLAQKQELNQTLISVLEVAGIAYCVMQYQEAEKLCVGLKKHGIVDYVCSQDRDVLLYGTSVITSIDFKTQTFEWIDYEKNLLEKGLTSQEELLLCAIASGTDYSKGLSKIGPITSIKMLKSIGKEEFLDLFKAQKVDYEAIFNYLTQDAGIRGLKYKNLDPLEFQKILRSMDFPQKGILEYMVNLMGHASIFRNVSMIPPRFELGLPGPHPDGLPITPRNL